MKANITVCITSGSSNFKKVKAIHVVMTMLRFVRNIALKKHLYNNPCISLLKTIKTVSYNLNAKSIKDTIK